MVYIMFDNFLSFLQDGSSENEPLPRNKRKKKAIIVMYRRIIFVYHSMYACTFINSHNSMHALITDIPYTYYRLDSLIRVNYYNNY